MDLEDDDEFFREFVNNVLDKATVAIVDKLEPKGLLDNFLQRNILGEATHVQIRDIKDERITSDQNRAIRALVRRTGNYTVFKEGLASTGQKELLHKLEAIESEMHDSLKEPHYCDSTESCRLLQQVKHQQLKISTQTSKHIPELQQHLLSIYEKYHMYWKSPVTGEQAIFSEMYVQPSVKCIWEINRHGNLTEVTNQSSQPSKLIYKDIFNSKTGGLCKNVYVTGEAGAGKSTFCNQLVRTWCKLVMNKSANSLSVEDHTLLSSFSILFHIILREAETTYHVKDMIQEQLLSNAPGNLNISDILKTEKCLIVLDGLDEWSCPENAKKCPKINKHIPGRNTENKNCFILTTSRNWKYDVIALENEDRDKYLELNGIDINESEELAKRMLNHLDREKKSKKKVKDFLKDVRQKKLNEFLSVPVLLIQLITLWFFGKDFGNSQLQLYCSMLDLLFEHSEKNLPEEFSKCSSTTGATPKQLPECFSTKDNCQTYAELLHCLGKLAYKALFNQKKEEALVFKSSKLEIFGISHSDIKLCLQCGILSQCKDYGNRTGKYKRFSFLHKKVQEFLAALFLVTNDNVEENLKEVKQFCYSVDVMFEMNQVWLFLAGMDPDMTRRLFERLDNVVSGDKRAKKYRQTLEYYRYSEYVILINRMKSFVADCVAEGINNGHHYENLSSEDFSVHSSSLHDVERLLLCSDMSKVKSVCIETENIDAAKIADITGQFQQCRSLQKLFLDDSQPPSLIPDCTLAALVKNNCDSLKSMYLWTKIKPADKLVIAICSSISKSLMALELFEVMLTHEHKQQILNSVSQSPTIRQLVLRLDCTDHVRDCKAMIDLSAMTQLQELTLKSYVHVYNLPSLPLCVKKVELHNVTLPVTSLRDFALRLPHKKGKVTVDLYGARFRETRPETRKVGNFVGFFGRKETKGLMREEECGNLKGFLRSCTGLKLSACEYLDRFNSWKTVAKNNKTEIMKDVVQLARKTGLIRSAGGWSDDVT